MFILTREISSHRFAIRYDYYESSNGYCFFQANKSNGGYLSSIATLGSAVNNCTFNLTNTGFSINPVSASMYYEGARYVALKNY